MRIALGSDHRGDPALKAITPILRARGYELLPVGPCDGTSRDYPDEAWLVGRAVASGEADRGVLICGSGIGVSIAANKIKGVRAALVSGEDSAEMCRRHNNANVICFSGDSMSEDELERCIDIFLKTEFEGGRHARRVDKIAAIERGEDPSTISPSAVGSQSTESPIR